MGKGAARRAGRVVLRVYREMQPQVDRQIAKFGPSTCSDGCNACCRLLAIADIPTMIPVVEYLTSLPDWEERKPKLLADIRNSLSVVMHTGLSDDADHPSRKAWWDLQVPCPLLSSGRCSVYPVRPAVCRYHEMVTPPELCHIVPAGGALLARVDLSPAEIKVTTEGAVALGELTAGTIPACFVLACRALGVDFPVEDELVRAGVLLHARIASR